jgi:hypothetical protein
VQSQRELLVIGKLTDAQEAEVARILKGFGLSVFRVGNALRPGALLQARNKADGLVAIRVRGEAWLKSKQLPDVFPKEFDKDTAREILNQLHIRTAYGLTQTTFEAFMAFGSRTPWEITICTSIIQFMIDEGVVFADLNPALVFRTPLTKRPDLSRLLNKISHLGWLEMFAFMTEHQARLCGLGPIWMGKVKRAMSDISIEFAPGH